jgi:hypothetical protein
MRARYIGKYCDQYVEDRAGGERICEQRDRGVATRQLLRRDA